VTRSSRLTCAAWPMLDRSLALPKPWSRGTDFAKAVPGGDRANLARLHIVGTRLPGGVAIAPLLACKLPDPGSAGPDGGMLWGGYGPVRQEAWAGPPPRAGARSFPRCRSLSRGVTRLTGTSVPADMGTGR
jgi:hypothetical protein